MNNLYPYGAKSEWIAQAEKIASGEIPTKASDIPMLMEWLKDLNWPGSDIIAKFLPSYGFALVDHVRKVLKSGDLVWIHWVLSAFKDAFDETFWLPLKDDLEVIGFQWDPEGAHIDSLYVLARFKFTEQKCLRSRINSMKNLVDVDPDDYVEIEAFLDK